jgi:protein-S-isoprenylcysteine O-methyltransferase Ste14
MTQVAGAQRIQQASQEPAPRPAGWPTLVYAASVYLLFVAVLCYAVGFFADIAVPKGIDGGPGGPAPVAAAVDVLLLSLFATQHTVMARPWFKRGWSRLLPVAAERATFVLCSTLALALLFWLWRPIGGPVWQVAGRAAWPLRVSYAAGWLIAIGSTFLISHLDLFGVRQAYPPARGRAYCPPSFVERGLYRLIRHPLMAGFVIIFWAAPDMTTGHLLLAAVATAYILVGIRFEEHDLSRELGEPYQEYRARVPALVPGLPHRARNGRGLRT